MIARGCRAVATDVATAIYYTGIDPFTKKPVYIAKQLRDRKLQRALLQYFKPENYFEVRKALEQAGRTDLIGSECDSLIPANPPKEALEKRRRQANEAANEISGDHIRGGPGKTPDASRKKPGGGYRPGRKSAGRRDGKKRR